MAAALPASGLLPFDFIEQFLHQGFRTLTASEAARSALKHLNAHWTAKGETPPLVIQVSNGSGTAQVLAADNTGFVGCFFGLHKGESRRHSGLRQRLGDGQALVPLLVEVADFYGGTGSARDFLEHHLHFVFAARAA
jgi:hypothetical protein